MALLGGMFIPAVSAESNKNLSDHIQEKKKNPIINIEDISEIISDIPEKESLNIPENFEKYELLTLDIQKMRNELANGRMVPICIDGVFYKMNLSEIMVNAPDVKSQTLSYTGHLENSNKSEVVLTISERVLIARINVNGIDYVIESIPHKEKSGKVIHYAHRSSDVKEEGEYLSGTDDYLAHKEYSAEELKIREIEAKTEEEEMAVRSEVAVRIRIFTDDQWISDEPDWQAKAQDIIAELNNQFQRSDIQVHFYAHYDTSKASALSGDINHISRPFQSIMDQVSITYLNSNHEDLALYLGGYDSTYNAVGATYGYDSPYPYQRRYAWVQMKDDPSLYDGEHEDRTKVTIHEIGHLFDADHQPGQQGPGQESYNRAYQWTEQGTTKQTALWAPFLKSNTYEISSNDYNGDHYHNNALRIYQTRNVIASYVW